MAGHEKQTKTGEAGDALLRFRAEKSMSNLSKEEFEKTLLRPGFGPES